MPLSLACSRFRDIVGMTISRIRHTSYGQKVNIDIKNKVHNNQVVLNLLGKLAN